MAKQHYHVGVNVPGYLPDSDVETYQTRKAAEMRAAEIKREILDDNWMVDDGSVHYSASGTARSGYIYIVNTKNAHDLGRVIWIEACTDDHADDGGEY